MGALILIATIAFAQEQEPFQPSGKVFMKVFSNFNTTISDGTSNSAFAIKRAYFGYEYNLSKNFYGKLNIDVADPGVGKLQMTAFLKNAYIKYHTEKLSVEFGLIATTSFKTMEGWWGNRYIEKTFQDVYKFNASADLGASAKYKVTDWISADLIVANGEGYKSLQADNQFRTGLGVTLNPVKNIYLRGYYDMMGSTDPQTTASVATAYKTKTFTAVAEYNLQNNIGNTSGKEFSGYSVYANYVATKKIKVFARYDRLTSNTLSGETANWNASKDGSLVLAGLEYSPVKGVKFAPNFRLWSPADAATANTTSFFLNCEIKF